jgi:hypothetical protein
MFKLASSTLPHPTTLPRDNPTTGIKDPNFAADVRMASHIVDDLKQNELATDKEFSASDLEQIIRTRFANVNSNIVTLAISMVMNDVESMKSRVAGSHEGFKLLVSARKPSFGNSPNQQFQHQQSQQPQQLQKQQQQQPPSQKPPQQLQQQKQPGQQTLNQNAAAGNYKDMSWKELRSIIIKGTQH